MLRSTLPRGLADALPRAIVVGCAVLALTACDGATRTLRLEWEGDGFARVTSAPAGLDCTGPCEAELPAGATVTLSVEAHPRSSFRGWEGCDEGTACSVTLDADRAVVVHVERDDRGVRLSDVDRHPDLLLRDDGLAVDFPIAGGAVRSIQSVGPGSGVSYFEVTRLLDDVTAYGFGVATREAPLSGLTPGEHGASFGLTVDGTVYSEGQWRGRVAAESRLGLVVDYRRDHPAVHVIAGGSIAYSEELASIREPLFVYLIGMKRAPGWHLEINPGNDTVNAPFAYDPRRALREAGYEDAASALTLGWGVTFAGEPDAPPAIDVPAAMEVERGAEVVLEASALDAEDGELRDRIEWELASSPFYAGRARGAGPRFAFTPRAVGVHPAVARVRDSAGHVSEAVVPVRVRGPVARRERVRLEPDARSGPGIELSPDGLAARWTAEGKNGIRANQALYGEFWYFEITRLVEPINQGGGIVVGDGNLAPYTLTDVPASCSLNTLDGVYRDLIWHSNLPLDPSTYQHYGFAVDYRGEHPTVYVITRGELVDELVLDEVWVEIYPMIYGNPTGLSAAGAYDIAINFGASPFAFDPRAVLSANGVSVDELQVGWGY